MAKTLTENQQNILDLQNQVTSNRRTYDIYMADADERQEEVDGIRSRANQALANAERLERLIVLLEGLN